MDADELLVGAIRAELDAGALPGGRLAAPRPGDARVDHALEVGVVQVVEHHAQVVLATRGVLRVALGRADALLVGLDVGTDGEAGGAVAVAKVTAYSLLGEAVGIEE